MADSPYDLELKIGYLMQNGVPNLGQVTGPALHVTAVINGLLRLGHEVRTLAIQNGRLNWSDDLQTWHPSLYGVTKRIMFRLIESSIRRVQHELKLPFWGLFDSLRFADACYNQLKGFDVLYERHGYMGYGGVLAARWLNIPLVLELNGNIIKEIDERGFNISPLQKKLGRWLTIQTFRAADRLVVVSNALKQTLVKDYAIAEEKISVVLNGVNLDVFTTQYDKSMIQDRYGLHQEPIIAFVGSFDPWHGVDLLLESFFEVQKNHPNAQLVMIGDGAGRERAVKHTVDLGLENKVKFLGRLPQDQVAAVLSVSKIAVAPYPFEFKDIVGTPLKLLDYMASGRAIVASTAPIHEIIEDCVTGLRVTPANVNTLANGIMRLLVDDELCLVLGKNAAQRAERYSWNNVVSELINLFKVEISKKAVRNL